MIMFGNSFTNLFDELNNMPIFIGYLIIFGLIIMYGGLIYTLIHDLFFPPKNEKEKNPEISFSFFNLINSFFYLNLLIVVRFPQTENIFTQILPNYMIILTIYLILCVFLLVFVFKDFYKQGKIGMYQFKFAFHYASIFGLMFSSISYFLYTLYANNNNFLIRVILMILLFVNMLAIIYFQKHPDSVYYYLLGASRYVNDESKSFGDLTEFEKQKIIEGRISKKTIVFSGVVNSLAIVIFILILANIFIL